MPSCRGPCLQARTRTHTQHSIIRAKPAVVNGAPRSDVKTAILALARVGAVEGPVVVLAPHPCEDSMICRLTARRRGFAGCFGNNSKLTRSPVSSLSMPDALRLLSWT